MKPILAAAVNRLRITSHNVGMRRRLHQLGPLIPLLPLPLLSSLSPSGSSTSLEVFEKDSGGGKATHMIKALAKSSPPTVQYTAVKPIL
jgi:hypothetical protein